jgi:hypothetical protein
MLTILESKNDIAKAQHEFSQSLQSYKPELISVSIGYQSGHFNTKVSWIASLGIWAHFGIPPEGKSSRSRRYWNVFGLERPAGMVNIVCEINPPVEGIDRRISGAFARTENDTIAVLHRGRFNVTGGMTMRFFRQRYSKKYVTVADERITSDVILVGEIGAPQFGDDLRRFVVEVDRIKSLARK